MKVKINAYAKINLMLDIIAKRTDGYHDLFMIMQSVSTHDTVTVTETKTKQIEITCKTEGIPLDEHNICWKAAESFFRYTKKKNKGISIDIKKKIPHAAGLAGGSADGAAVILALDKIYKTALADKELCEIGVKIGADLPFCLTGGTLLAQGIGDKLSKVKALKKCYIVLAKPDYDVNTGYAYSQFDEYGKTRTPDKFGMLCAIQSGSLENICSKMENVFEQFIEVPKRIDIKEILKRNSALGVCMSGSGPTVFGIFENKEDAEKAAYELKDIAKDIDICTPVRKGCKIMEITE